MFYVVPYIIKSAIETYAFFANLFKMTNPHPDIFDTLLSSSISSDIALFVESHCQFAMATNEPAYALQHRFPVDAIGINKARLPAQHESLAIWVSDQKTLKHHEFVIE